MHWWGEEFGMEQTIMEQTIIGGCYFFLCYNCLVTYSKFPKDRNVNTSAISNAIQTELILTDASVPKVHRKPQAQ